MNEKGKLLNTANNPNYFYFLTQRDADYYWFSQF